MKKYLLLTIFATVMIGLAGCKGETEVYEPIDSIVEDQQGDESDSSVEDQSGNESDPSAEDQSGKEIDPATEEQLRNEIEKNLEEYDEEAMVEGYLDYSMRLFAGSVQEGTNSMISPVSVMMALDMAAAGANGETQEQITNLFCEGASQAQIENFCRELMDRYESSQGVELHLANSVWIKDTVADQIKDEYLIRSDYIFDAEAVIAPFDQTTVDAVNQWCDDHTDGMIDHLLNDIDPKMQLILMNATAMDAPWMEQYEEYQISEDMFTNAGGVVENVKMLNGTENNYFETEDAVGFMKYYEGGEYAFLAILPEENMTVDEYVQSLTGEKYLEFWNSRTTDYDVDTKMPEFTYEYELNMNSVLQDMGMTQAFTGAADFTGIADLKDGLYIDTVLHKTFVEVGQNGTRAAAVTAVIMEAAAMLPEERERKQVYLDRPFVYAIVEVDTGMPLFIGTLQSI